MPPETPRRIRLMPESCLLLAVVVDDLALGGLLEGHRQVVLRARLDQRRRELVERPLTELVVVVVDLARALGRDDHERIARVDLIEKLIDAGMDHGRDMVAGVPRCPATIAASASAARLRSSFSTTWSKSCASWSCSRALRSRSSITPVLSVARSRSRRSSSSTGAVTNTVTASAVRRLTRSAPSVSSSRSGALP